jgi:ethanolamine utilization protein EutA (predicted chaperonin)
MDFGSTLVLVFGTPAAIAVARGIYEAMKRFSTAVVIKTRSGEIIATGDAAGKMNVDAVVAALSQHARATGK